jgi:hypothetical protein
MSVTATIQTESKLDKDKHTDTCKEVNPSGNNGACCLKNSDCSKELATD